MKYIHKGCHGILAQIGDNDMEEKLIARRLARSEERRVGKEC